MKVLLTGATGFIGKVFLSLLSRYGIPVVVLGRHSPEPSSDVSFIPCDLLNDVDLKEKVIQAKCSHHVWAGNGKRKVACIKVTRANNNRGRYYYCFGTGAYNSRRRANEPPFGR